MLTIEKKEGYFVGQSENSYKEYRRIIGGFSWPSPMKSGFMIVIAEDYHKDKNLDKRHYHIMTEYENDDAMELLKYCHQIQNRYCIERWCGDDKNLPMMELLSKFNRGKKKGVYISSAPFLDDPHAFEYYVSLIKDKIVYGKKILYFGEESKLPVYLMELAPEKVSNSRNQDYPAIRALGYIISALEIDSIDNKGIKKIIDMHFDKYDIIDI